MYILKKVTKMQHIEAKQFKMNSSILLVIKKIEGIITNVKTAKYFAVSADEATEQRIADTTHYDTSIC